MDELRQKLQQLDRLDYELGQLYIKASSERKSYSKQIHLVRLSVVKAKHDITKIINRGDDETIRSKKDSE